MAAERSFPVTFLKDKYASKMFPKIVTSAELQKLIQETHAVGADTNKAKEKLPWLKLAVFGDKLSDKGSLRHNANVLAINGIELDYDGKVLPFEDAVKVLKDKGLQFIAYTSPSYTVEEPKWRILCITSKELPPTDRVKLVARINGLFDGAFSNETWTLSQGYFYGSVNNNPQHKCEYQDGDYIDLRDDLDAVALGKGQRRLVEDIRRLAAANGSNDGLDFDAGDVGGKGVTGYLALLGDGPGLEGFHTPLRGAAASFVATQGAGFDREVLKALMRDAISKAPTTKPRGYLKTDKHLNALIDSAAAKFANAGVNDTSNTVSGGKDMAALLSDIKAGENPHNAVEALAAKLVASGAADTSAITIIQSAMDNTSRERDEEWQDSYSEIPNIVKVARDKFTTSGGHDDLLEKMNKDYCVLPIGGKSRVLKFAEEIEFYPNHEFRALLDNNKVKVGKKLMGKGSWWLNQPNRRQYDGLVFKPGLDPVVRGKMNLWKGFAIEPKKGDWHLMRKHVSEVVASGNADYEDYIIKWVAWSLQNPGAPAEVVLVLRGGKGTGKGVFAREIKKIFGIHGAQISSVDHLAGRFNAHLMQCAFLFADEAFWPGDKSHEGTLKRMVTERTLFIERKGVDGFEVDNCLHILMAANAEWVVPASMDERRYACFNLIETNKQSDAYFAPLYKEIENGGTAAMLYDMLKMDLQGWHPRQNVPQTDALRMQQEHSLSYVDQWWLSLLEAGALPGRLENNPRRAPSRTLFEHARRDVPGLRFSSDNLLGGVLRAHGCFSFNHAGIRGWTFPSLKDAREEWSVKMPTTWDDPEREDWFEAANWEKEPY